MSSIEFLSPTTPVENVYPNNDLKPPRTSLDFVIRQSGIELDDQYVRIQSLSARDSVGELFEYQVEFRANDALESGQNSAPLDFAQVIGSTATIRIGLADDASVGTYPDPAFVSFFNGIISDLSLQESGVYTCTIRPALWRLTLVNDYRRYSQVTIKEVIEAIVKEKWGLECDTSGLGSLATYRTQDWMQLGESDWEFIQSLLHKVGGFFYFIHDDTSHTVVFANNPSRNTYYQNIPPAGSTDSSQVMPVFYTFSTQVSYDEEDYLKSFRYEQKLVSPSVRNVLAEPQAAWEQNAVADLHTYTNGPEDTNGFQRYRAFQFGATQALATTLNKEDAWTIESSGFRLSGECTSPRFKPGYVFETRLAKANGERTDVCLMRPELDKQRFVILSVQHRANVDGSYSNQFTAAPALGNATELSLGATRVGSVLGQVVSKSDQRAKYKNHWQLEKGLPNFDPEVKTFYSADGTPYKALGVYVDFPGLAMGEGPVWVKLSETMTTIPESGVTVLVDRSRDDTDVPQISMIYEQKGSKTIMPNGTLENTRIGDDYATSYGDSRNISYGAKSAVNLPAAIAKIDGEYASGNFKSAQYSIGGNYSYSSSDKGKSGILSKSYAEGITYQESHGDSHNKVYADSTTNHSEIGSTKDSSKIGSSSRKTTIGTTTESSAIGASNSNTVTGASNVNSLTVASNTNQAVGVGININATGFETNVSFVGMRISAGVQNELALRVRGGLRLVDTGAEMEARLDGLQAQIKELQLKM